MNTKVCTKCKVEHTVDMFSFESKSKNKLQARCKICDKEYRDTNKEKLSETARRYRQDNAEDIKRNRAKKYADNSEAILKRQAERRLANRDAINTAKREYMKEYRKKNYSWMYEYFKEYRDTNREKLLPKRAASECKRRAALMDRTPPWLDAQHLKDIEEFYTEAKRLELETGTKHHVDHIVPLLGKTVCGLHVPWNLQVLTAYENQTKSNKLIYDYEQSNLIIKE